MGAAIRPLVEIGCSEIGWWAVRTCVSQIRMMTVFTMGHTSWLNASYAVLWRRHLFSLIERSERGNKPDKKILDPHSLSAASTSSVRKKMNGGWS